MPNGKAVPEFTEWDQKHSELLFFGANLASKFSQIEYFGMELMEACDEMRDMLIAMMKKIGEGTVSHEDFDKINEITGKYEMLSKKFSDSLSYEAVDKN